MAPKVKIAKNSKLPKLPENCFEPIGQGGWPLISTWINPPSLGSNDIHCVECPGEREKHLLNLNLGELLALLETSRCSVLWKATTSMWLEGLDIFNQSRYMRFFCVE
jgi:hypothetical protein